MLENSFINVKNRSKTITANIEVPKGGVNGVILGQGGRFGGWSLYAKKGKPAYTYNFLGLEQFTIASKKKLPAGDVTVVLYFDYDYDYDYDGGGFGKGGTAKLIVNGKTMAENRIDKTQPHFFLLTRQQMSGSIIRHLSSPELVLDVKRQNLPGVFKRSLVPWKTLNRH